MLRLSAFPIRQLVFPDAKTVIGYKDFKSKERIRNVQEEKQNVKQEPYPMIETFIAYNY